MKTAQFTPGPWVAEEGWNSTRPTITAKISQTQVIDYRGLVADLEKTAFTEQAQANAHLIAAAPAMYEAIKQVLEHREREYLDNTIEPYCLLEAAIAKAEGRHPRKEET